MQEIVEEIGLSGGKLMYGASVVENGQWQQSLVGMFHRPEEWIQQNRPLFGAATIVPRGNPLPVGTRVLIQDMRERIDDGRRFHLVVMPPSTPR